MDECALEHYLTFLIPPAPLTMFKNISKLEPGHLLIVEENGDSRNEQYWNPVAIDQPSIRLDGEPAAHSELLDDEFTRSEGACIETIRRLLKQSIKDRMMSDVPFGVFLSGGIDSSTNVALMAELMNRPVDTFSVGFRDLEKYNELGYARQIAKEFKTNHHEIIIDQKDAFEFLPKLIFHQDEPLADPVCIPLYFVSKLARDNGTIVVQVGEGSDEQFAGYQWMKRELLFYRTIWKWFGVFPDVVRNGVLNLASIVLKPRQSFLALDYIRKSAEGDELFWGGAINFTESHKRQFLARRLAAFLPQQQAHRWHDEMRQADPRADYLKHMIYLEFRQRLPELLLMRVDKVAMATSVEARVPFLDHRMVEYSMRIPQSYKLKHGETKYILKKAVEGIIPRNIIYRRKQGFAAPMNEWLRNEWSGFVAHAIQTSKLMNSGIFQREEVTKLVKRHQSGELQAGQLLWNLLNLVLWHRYWIEGEPIE